MCASQLAKKAEEERQRDHNEGMKELARERKKKFAKLARKIVQKRLAAAAERKRQKALAAMRKVKHELALKTRHYLQKQKRKDTIRMKAHGLALGPCWEAWIPSDHALPTAQRW